MDGPEARPLHFLKKLLKFGEDWSHFKTELYLEVAESPMRRRGFSSIAAFSPVSSSTPINSDLSLSTCAISCQLSYLRFPSFASSQVSQPPASHRGWAEVSGGSQGEHKDDVVAVTSAPCTCWCSQFFWTCFVLVMSPFSPLLLQKGNTKRKTGFGNRWLGEEKKKDGSAAHGTAVHCCTASLLAPWTQPGFYIVSQSPCKGMDVWLPARWKIWLGVHVKTQKKMNFD